MQYNIHQYACMYQYTFCHISIGRNVEMQERIFTNIDGMHNTRPMYAKPSPNTHPFSGGWCVNLINRKEDILLSGDVERNPGPTSIQSTAGTNSFCQCIGKDSCLSSGCPCRASNVLCTPKCTCFDKDCCNKVSEIAMNV